MKLLDTEFESKGYRYTQISRDGDVAVYEQRWLSALNGSVAYEVVIIQRHTGFAAFGKDVPPSEFYPSSKKWGELGWTFTDRDRALGKANEVAVARVNQQGSAQIPFHRRALKEGRRTTKVSGAA